MSSSEISATAWVRPVHVGYPEELCRRARRNTAALMAARGETTEATLEVLEMLGLVEPND